MASDRTVVTELGTALGMVGDRSIESVLDRRPAAFANLGEGDWARLAGLWDDGVHRADFEAAFANGQAFLSAPGALRGRRPAVIEWTGGRRPPGDEVVPSDLRVDHVYLVSCKYLSRILHNPSPARLVEGLLAQEAPEDRRDWYERTAPREHQVLYDHCRSLLDAAQAPARVGDLTVAQRRALAVALRAGWPSTGAMAAYGALCAAVATSTAQAWRERLVPRRWETMLWRLLRIGSAPYFILGRGGSGGAGESMRLRIDTPWDWRQRYRLRTFEVSAQAGGQPRVGWRAEVEVSDGGGGARREILGHVELRWSHGRFGQPPEAKVYLDTPHHLVPGYHLL